MKLGRHGLCVFCNLSWLPPKSLLPFAIMPLYALPGHPWRGSQAPTPLPFLPWLAGTFPDLSTDPYPMAMTIPQLSNNIPLRESPAADWDVWGTASHLMTIPQAQHTASTIQGIPVQISQHTESGSFSFWRTAPGDPLQTIESEKMGGDGTGQNSFGFKFLSELPREPQLAVVSGDTGDTPWGGATEPQVQGEVVSSLVTAIRISPRVSHLGKTSYSAGSARHWKKR